MFELADYLVGIYKVDDCTRSLTIQNADKELVLGAIGKEYEKENFSESMNVGTTSPKSSVLSQKISENASQNGSTHEPMDVSQQERENNEIDESMETSSEASQKETPSLYQTSSPNLSQTLSQDNTHISGTSEESINIPMTQ